MVAIAFALFCSSYSHRVGAGASATVTKDVRVHEPPVKISMCRTIPIAAGTVDLDVWM